MLSASVSEPIFTQGSVYWDCQQSLQWEQGWSQHQPSLAASLVYIFLKNTPDFQAGERWQRDSSGEHEPSLPTPEPLQPKIPSGSGWAADPQPGQALASPQEVTNLLWK